MAKRGKGGIGRRDAKDLFPEDTGHQGGQRAGKHKEPKRRLFGGVSNRLNMSEANIRGGGGGSGGGNTEAGSEGGGDTRQWRTPSRMKGSKAEAALLQGAGLSASANSPEASGGESREGVSGKPTGAWVKPQKGGPTPDRFTRFLGKMLGVRDDALPSSTESGNSGGDGGSGGGSGSNGVAEDNPGAGRDASPGLREVSARTRSSNSAATSQSLQGISGTQGGATEPGVSDDTRGGQQQQQGGSLPVSVGEAQASSGTSAATAALGAAAAAAAPGAELEPVTATAVYPATTISTATADAMPMAVAVAFPVSEGAATALPSEPASGGRRPSRTGAAATRSEPAASARRPSRTSRPHRTTTTTPAAAATRTEDETPAVGLGDSVSISDWIDREQRGSGGLVRVFSAQRVLGNKVQKKCRLAVSPKTMTQVSEGCLARVCRGFDLACKFGGVSGGDEWALLLGAVAVSTMPSVLLCSGVFFSGCFRAMWCRLRTRMEEGTEGVARYHAWP